MKNNKLAVPSSLLAIAAVALIYRFASEIGGLGDIGTILNLGFTGIGYSLIAYVATMGVAMVLTLIVSVALQQIGRKQEYSREAKQKTANIMMGLTIASLVLVIASLGSVIYLIMEVKKLSSYADMSAIMTPAIISAIVLGVVVLFIAISIFGIVSFKKNATDGAPVTSQVAGTNSPSAFEVKSARLKQYKNDGIISEEDYQKRMKDLMDEEVKNI
jgi:hypothetical protein